MKNQFIALFVTVCMTQSGGAALAEMTPGHMEGHQHAMGTAMESAHADVKMHQACPHCGMDREKFAHSRMLITYSDGTSVGVCSIHCVVTELKAQKGKVIKMVEVADLNTKKLVDAEKATWVIGGSKKGVMTRNPKWAFAQKADAIAFISKNGGQLATYKDVLALAGKE
ncbi:MAG: nitrous oxide reductase accessory protein NosL [Deltaproteobacteria bacterium]|jgi:nitrous oxide reductase accessory protein NosL|nr:nitrous oxide reductase accessory protein NosL [Deltaproteobacteria bacterium]